MTKIFSNLFKTDRPRTSSVQGRTIVTESESDRGRILFCAAFRRLQQKAQVFSMEPNAAVRSRLTHSLEVAQIGRYIADSIAERLPEDDADADEKAALVTFVENACLMHDIGNPPFGHFGEAAIRKWFVDNGYSAIEKSCSTYRPDCDGNRDDRTAMALADFLEFDGNPQGLRIVTKLQWNKDPNGLNLTKTTLASYLKYMRMAGAESDNRAFTKKAGYFLTEKSLVADIHGTFGYSKPQRFPLAYIMEAADDIAYCISDLEDSIEKGLLDQGQALRAIHEEWMSMNLQEDETKNKITDALVCAMHGFDSSKGEYTFTDFRTELSRTVVAFAANRFIEYREEILQGTLDSLVPEKSAAGSILEILKNYCRQKVYCHESVQWTELAGYTAIYGLLDHFKILLNCSADRFQKSLAYANKDSKNVPIVIEKKILQLFPERYIKAYRHTIDQLEGPESKCFEFYEWNARAHLIVDFVSGMTDDFAMTTYQTLSGMKT